MTWSSAPMLRLILEATRPGTLVVSVGGELDLATSDQLVQAMSDWLADHRPRLVVLDLSGVTFLGASGLSALLRVRDLAARARAALRLVATGSDVLRPMRATYLAGEFDIADSVSAALPSDEDHGPFEPSARGEP